MKKLTETPEKELRFTDAKGFLELALNDPKIAEGEIDNSMGAGIFEGKIDLNILTIEIKRYITSKMPKQ